MKKTILFPTDFTIESLNAVKAAFAGNKNEEPCDIILLCGIGSGDSISDLLFFSRSKLLKSLASDEFDMACNVLRNKFASRISSIRKDIFSGFTQSAFDIYVEANNVSEAYVPGNYTLQLKDKRSFDLLPFIRKSQLKVYGINWEVKNGIPEKGKLAELFLNDITH